MTLSIVIPCYNEAENIPVLLEKLKHSLTAHPDIDIVLVENGSKDDSAEVLNSLAPRYPFVSVVTVPVNQGYGYGILCGLKEAKGQFLGWTHADLQTDPGDLVIAWELLKKQANPHLCFAKGSRRGRAVFDIAFSIGLALFETVFLGAFLWEINAQPNVFSRQFFESWKNPPHDYALDLYAYCLAKKRNITMLRFPVLFPPRIHGYSTWNGGFKEKFAYIKRILAYSLSLRKRLKTAL